MGAGNVLAVNGALFRPDWAGPLPLMLLHWPRATSICGLQVPLKFETFLRVGGEGIRLQQTLVTDLAAVERRKHSFNNLHICARYTVTEVKATARGGRVFSPYRDPTKQANKHAVKRLSLLCQDVKT